MATVVDWTLDRPPILGIDFPDDHANGERARDLWYMYECRRRPADRRAIACGRPAGFGSSTEASQVRRREVIVRKSACVVVW